MYAVDASAVPASMGLSGGPQIRLGGTLRRKLAMPGTCGIVDVDVREEKDVPVGMLVPHKSRAVTTVSCIVRMVVGVVEIPATRAWEDGLVPV